MANCTECKEKRAEEAVREMNGGHSEEWSLSRELAKSNKRWFVISMTILALWIVTIFAFLWYLNQYDYSSYEVSQGGEWGNTFIGESNEGDITYGAENSSETENKEGQVKG